MVEGKGGGRKKREGEGEAKLRYETMENLAIPPPLTVCRFGSREDYGFPFPSSPPLPPPLHLQPSPFSRAEKEGEGSASTRLTDEPF